MYVVCVCVRAPSSPSFLCASVLCVWRARLCVQLCFRIIPSYPSRPLSVLPLCVGCDVCVSVCVCICFLPVLPACCLPSSLCSACVLGMRCHCVLCCWPRNAHAHTRHTHRGRKDTNTHIRRKARGATQLHEGEECTHTHTHVVRVCAGSDISLCFVLVAEECTHTERKEGYEHAHAHQKEGVRNDVYIYIYIYMCVCVCVCVCPSLSRLCGLVCVSVPLLPSSLLLSSLFVALCVRMCSWNAPPLLPCFLSALQIAFFPLCVWCVRASVWCVCVCVVVSVLPPFLLSVLSVCEWCVCVCVSRSPSLLCFVLISFLPLCVVCVVSVCGCVCVFPPLLSSCVLPSCVCVWRAHVCWCFHAPPLLSIRLLSVLPLCVWCDV